MCNLYSQISALQTKKMRNLTILIFAGLYVASSGSVIFDKKPKCEHLLDVVAVLDGSETIFPDEFQTIREVMAEFVEDLGVSNWDVHFGAVLYSTDVSEVVPLSGNKAHLISSMNKLHQPRSGTRTDLGMEEMINVFETSGRPGVPRVGIVVTDGVSNRKELTSKMAKKARNLGINMFSVGIGSRIEESELKEIASKPEQAVFIEDVDTLADSLQKLQKHICKVLTTTTTTTTTTPKPTTTTPKPTTTTPKPTTTTPEPTTTTTTRKPTTTTPKPTTTTPEPTTTTSRPTTTTPKPTTTTPEPTTTTPKPTTTTPKPTTTTPEPTTTPKPTTTTPEPTTTTPESTTQRGPCYGCRMRNGIGYNSHKECNKFYQCSFSSEGDLLTYSIQTCGVGTFWNQDKLTCDFMSKVNCPNDRCSILKGLTSYKLGGDCADYVECVNGKSKTSKCLHGYAYSEDDDVCVKDASCTVGVEICARKTCFVEECNFWKVPDTACSYYWTKGNQGWLMHCPPGTKFSQKECECVLAGRNSCKPRQCAPIVDIDFNSDEPGEYDNYGAVISDGLAYFDGYSSIKILRLANVEFTSKLSIYIRFKPENGNATRKVSEAVVSNGDCGEESTLSLLNNGAQTTLTIKDRMEHTTTLRDRSNSLWREGEYKIGQGEVQSLMTMNGKSFIRSSELSDLPKRSQCAFQLGHGTGFQDFKGWVDYIMVSTC